MGEKPLCKSPAEDLYQTQWDGLRQREEEEEEKHFSMLMESLGANSVFEEWAVCVCVSLKIVLFGPPDPL